MKRKKERGKRYRIIRKLILAILIFYMLYSLKGVYREDNIRLEEKNNHLNKIREIYQENSSTLNKDYLAEKIIKVEENVIEKKLPKKYRGFDVIAKIEIPKISLNTYILKEYSKDAMDVCITKFWGPNPNEIGNFCIVGHNYQKENMFNNLIDLKLNDEIYLLDDINGKIKYLVYDIYKVKANNVNPIEQETNGKKEVTLITCVNYTDNRLIIKAKEAY